ncbi:MAG: M24 family metallopeptidase [Bacteroidota bacterium]
MDQFRSTLPLLVFGGASTKPVLVAKEIDRTNVEHASDGTLRFVFHSPYFSFDRLEHSAPSDVYPDVTAAFSAVVDDEVTLDADLPVALYSQLAGELRAGSPQLPRFTPPLNHYIITRSTVDEQRRMGRARGLSAAEPFMPFVAKQDVLRDWLTRPIDDSFSVLDDLMASAGLDSILATSPINVQQLTGIAAPLVSDSFALYARGSDSIHLLSRREIPWVELPEQATTNDQFFAGSINRGSVGYEELDLSMSAFCGFGLDHLNSQAGSSLLRRWRELRAWEDLGFYLAGAQITRLGIEAALRHVEHGGPDVCEWDAYEIYKSVVAHELRAESLPLRVRTYFNHTHAGNRSHIPARATKHSLRPLTSLKIDAGLELYDEQGYLRAVSDITRSAVGTSEAETFYKLLDRALTVGVIDGCKPGLTGHDMFMAGMDFLEQDHALIRDLGFCPGNEATLAEMFGRDIGHLLGKQEPATVAFEKNNQQVIESGMIAAAELQWPYHDYCIGVEDIFLIADTHTVNLTRSLEQTPA